ncbi:hypothetical protein HJG60_010940 [Phyllostomus discolor]|uniref:Uncharacterized protein n=1 Tax=Phyllostomus discolor TaxID=89673 RepID=A0A834EAC8_9CHIR|nr:hypothetical protein HJG60_010940 [Phyllostomus discolor]
MALGHPEQNCSPALLACNMGSGVGAHILSSAWPWPPWPDLLLPILSSHEQSFPVVPHIPGSSSVPAIPSTLTPSNTSISKPCPHQGLAQMAPPPRSLLGPSSVEITSFPLCTLIPHTQTYTHFTTLYFSLVLFSLLNRADLC